MGKDSGNEGERIAAYTRGYSPLLILKILFRGYETKAMIGHLPDAEGFFDA